MGKNNDNKAFLTTNQKNAINTHLDDLDITIPTIKAKLKRYLTQILFDYDHLNEGDTPPTKSFMAYTNKWAEETLPRMKCQSVTNPILFGILAFSLSLPTAGQCLIGVSSLTTPEAWLIAACIALVVTAAVAIPLAVTGKNQAKLFASETKMIRSDAYRANFSR